MLPLSLSLCSRSLLPMSRLGLRCRCRSFSNESLFLLIDSELKIEIETAGSERWTEKLLLRLLLVSLLSAPLAWIGSSFLDFAGVQQPPPFSSLSLSSLFSPLSSLLSSVIAFVIHDASACDGSVSLSSPFSLSHLDLVFSSSRSFSRRDCTIPIPSPGFVCSSVSRTRTRK